MNIKHKVAIVLGGVGLVGASIFGTVAVQSHAANLALTNAAATTTSSNTPPQGGPGGQQGNPPAAVGTVTAISGDTLTVTDAHTSTTYTVDATNATITKMSASTTAGTQPTQTTISVSDIAVGDIVGIQGTVSGTSISATAIMDGVPANRPGQGGGPGHGGPGNGTTGTVTAVNGSTITLTGSNGTTYTIDATNASVKKISSATISDIAVGDTLNVQGTTSGTSVTASNILDGALGGPGQPATTTAPPANE